MTKELLNYFKGDELAASVWQGKYAQEGEKTPDDMHRRLAKEFYKIEENYFNLEKNHSYEVNKKDLSKYGQERKHLTEERIYDLFNDFKYIVPQGSVMSQLGTKSIGSLSNCFVIGQPEDSYGGIFLKDEEMAQLEKRRGGVGLDISTLRPEGVSTTNAAKSSTGAVSFMHRYSNTTREVAQNGRRGALMLSISVNHPDVLDFAKIKRDLSQVTGANISIKLNDKFMRAVESDEDYILRFPVDSEVLEGFEPEEYGVLKKIPSEEIYVKKVKAKEYWEEIIKSAHNVAEPGLMFEDNHFDYSPDGSYKQYKGVTTNPCFTGNTRLLTAEGYKTFEDLEDLELNLINKNGEVVQGTVWNSGIKEIYKIKTWNKKEIECTEDHLFLTVDNEEVEAKNLKGKRLMPYYIMNKEVSEYTKLGFLQGDGNLTRLNSDKHLGLEINIGEDDEDVAELFEIEFEKGKRNYYTTGYNPLLKLLKFQPKVLPERGLPKTISNWEDKDILMFLKGLYSANGSVITGKRVSFKTTCKALAEDMRILLLKFNITSYITTNKSKEVKFNNGNYICKESYDLNISTFEGVKTFAEKIGFVHKYKTDSLESLILKKAPLVSSVKNTGGSQKVYDFNLQDNTHWGVVEGVIAHNCGEIFMQPYDACRLIAVNLYSFVKNPFTQNSIFDFDKFYSVNYEAMRLSDDLVDLELEHIDRIISKIESDPESEETKRTELNLWKKVKATAKSSRRTGLGFTALGDAIAALDLKYDSDEALEIIDKIMNVKMESELDCTIDLSILRGHFEGWDINNEFIPRSDTHQTWKEYGNRFYYFIESKFQEQARRMRKYGRRNVSFSTVAPTGTVSLMTQTTSGIEPIFQPFYMRRKKVNPNDTNVRIDFTDQNGDNWQEYPVLHEKFKDWIRINHPDYDNTESVDYGKVDIAFKSISKDILQEMFEESPWYKSTANDIDWGKRVEIQGIVQKYISHSISSTINLPEDVKEEEVSEIYLESWKKGLKGITVYRDGSRSGVLVNEDSKTKEDTFTYHDAPKRPKKLTAEINTLTALGKRFTVIVGLMDDKPYEIFVEEGDDIVIEKGEIVKKKKGVYVIEGNMKESKITQTLNLNLSDEELALTRMISTALRHGANIKFIVEQLNKSNGTIVSFSKAIARTLKKYIPDGEKATVTCQDCGSDNVVFEEGCHKCLDCGSSKCG